MTVHPENDETKEVIKLLGYETTDADAGPVVRFAIFLLVLTLAIAGLVVGFYKYLDARETAEKAQRYPMSDLSVHRHHHHARRRAQDARRVRLGKQEHRRRADSDRARDRSPGGTWVAAPRGAARRHAVASGTWGRANGAVGLTTESSTCKRGTEGCAALNRGWRARSGVWP
jgi:hypothetical protein